MTLEKALRALTATTYVTRKGGKSVRRAVGTELATYHRYVEFDGDEVATFDATAEDLAATDWEVRDLGASKPAETKPTKKA